MLLRAALSNSALRPSPLALVALSLLGALGAAAPLAAASRPALLASEPHSLPAAVPLQDAEVARDGEPGAAPLREGRAALAEGRRADAVRHLREALVFRPGDAEVLALLVAATADAPDARLTWSYTWWAAAADADGRASVPRELRDALAADGFLPQLAQSRAQAAAELARLAETREKRGRKSPHERVVAWWARRLALELASEAPALARAHAGALDATVAVPDDAHEPVVSALERALSAALAGRSVDTAMRAARCLHGLAVQAGFDDLQGERPRGMDRVLERAREGLARARDLLEHRLGEPWTVAELEMFTAAEAEAFTREHASFANPGVALSPRGWYRVETDCGYETLLGVARTIEAHHERLVTWYGRDPFESVRGTVRVVPEAAGLEAEGIPFWWAGGMQAGNVTTMRFSVGSIEELGHGLTHELTHRFDGVLFPGQMPWLTEGKAVWTGAAFGHSSDPEFVPNHASFGTLENAWIKGYGGLEKLTELIEAEIEDYRDNYVAGYALWVYVSTWEENGRRLYAPRLAHYMEGSFRGNRRPTAWFEEHFCDGADGRPADLEAFAAKFDEFLAGFYWQDRKPFTERYTEETPRGGGGLVYDEPTWTWARQRAEPFFGGEQARLAGELLADLGKTDEAVDAFVWSLGVDGRQPALERRLAGLLRELRRGDAAWVLESLTGAPEPAPFLESLPRLRAHLDGLREAARICAESSRPVSAAMLAARHDRLAAAAGAPLLEPAAPPAVPPFCRFDPPVRHLALGAPSGERDADGGWVEAGLTDYEEFRVEHLWYADDHGDLHVGREKPREGTGRMDRRAHRRHAFARSTAWQLPGTYRVAARIQLTTSFVNGALILGWTRRDQHQRLTFSAGDFLYSIGAKDEEPQLESVSWRLDGLRERDHALPGALPGGTVDFPNPLPTFDLEVLVDGGTAHVSINGEHTGTYHTVDGAPIEGHIGFASSYGAFRAQRPAVERLDASRLTGRPEAVPAGLAFERLADVPFEDLLNHVCRGVERSSTGTLLLWIAAPDRDADELFDVEGTVRRAADAVDGMVDLLDFADATQPLALAVPAALGQEGLAALRARVAEDGHALPPLHLHAGDGRVPEGYEDTPDRGKRWIVFLDPAGAVRVVAPFLSFRRDLPDRLKHWMTVFRDHGRPTRDLPPVPPRAARTTEDGE